MPKFAANLSMMYTERDIPGYPPGRQDNHLKIAGVPERHEPGLGELHHPYLFSVLDELGYAGHIGCEYRPRTRTSAGLGWPRPYQQHGDIPCES